MKNKPANMFSACFTLESTRIKTDRKMQMMFWVEVLFLSTGEGISLGATTVTILR